MRNCNDGDCRISCILAYPLLQTVVYKGKTLNRHIFLYSQIINNKILPVHRIFPHVVGQQTVNARTFPPKQQGLNEYFSR